MGLTGERREEEGDQGGKDHHCFLAWLGIFEEVWKWIGMRLSLRLVACVTGGGVKSCKQGGGKVNGEG